MTTTPVDEPKDADELINALNQATTEEQLRTQESSEPAPDLHANTDDDFEPARKEETAPAEEPMTPSKAKGKAKTYINWFNSLLKMILPSVYKKTILKKGDEEKMRAFVATSKARGIEEAVHEGHEMFPISNRFDRYIKAVEELPLNQDEIDMIAEPLSELVLKYKRMQLSPEWSLVFAVMIVMMPRIEPMMPDLSKIFAAAEKKTAK